MPIRERSMITKRQLVASSTTSSSYNQFQLQLEYKDLWNGLSAPAQGCQSFSAPAIGAAVVPPVSPNNQNDLLALSGMQIPLTGRASLLQLPTRLRGSRPLCIVMV